MFKLKRSVGANTKLTLSQHVPGSKWFLAPNPAIKIAHKGLAGRHSLLEGSWDTLTRSGATSMTVYGGEDKAYKAEVALHSHKARNLSSTPPKVTLNNSSESISRKFVFLPAGCRGQRARQNSPGSGTFDCSVCREQGRPNAVAEEPNWRGQ